METNNPFIKFPLNLDAVLALISLQFVANGLYVTTTFELESSCASFTQHKCPHHDGTDPCECRLSVLLVYDESSSALSLILHEFDGKTEIFFPRESRLNHANLESRVKKALQEEYITINSFINA